MALGDDLEVLAALPRLRSLRLLAATFEVSAPPVVPALPQLEALYLEICGRGDESDDEERVETTLGRLPALTCLVRASRGG